jgi:SAM-dependent methyltransferase
MSRAAEPGDRDWLVPQRRNDPELLDRPDNPAPVLERAVRDLGAVNRWLGGRRALLRGVRPFLRADVTAGPLHLLDVGTGGADLPLSLIAEAERVGRELTVTAVDHDPRTASIAAGLTRHEPRVRVVCADAGCPPFPPGSFDLVTASMFLHHFEHGEIVRLLTVFRRLARRAVVVNDLRRHRLPWAFIGLAARVTWRQEMFVHDAPLSVLRGFTPGELRRAARDCGADGARLERLWPFRLLLVLPGAETP